MADIKRRALLVAPAVIVAAAPSMSLAAEKLEGKVVRTDLTACQPRPNGGGCAGTLTLETKTGSEAQQVSIKVTPDTIIKKGADYIFLPQTQNSLVVVTYVSEKGQKVAQAIDVSGTAR